MIVLKIFGRLIHAVLSVIIFPLQICLTVIMVFFSVAASYVMTIGSILSFLFITASIFCFFYDGIERQMFWQMLLTGLSCGAIPSLLYFAGEEGILAMKNVLDKCLDW